MGTGFFFELGDFSMDDWALGLDQRAEIEAHLNHEIHNIRLETDGYYDITFQDGYTIYAVHILHIVKHPA